MAKKGADKTESRKATVEYSSREVAPPALLVQQLLQAHYIFCLHHGPLLSELHLRLGRQKFCSTLERFWTRFARTWDVLLHGNPASDVFSGFKLASGGELGFGVGEEDWGSGERDVLEDLVRRTDGLEDLLVARFGEPDTSQESGKSLTLEPEGLPWIGGGHQPLASDGIVFGGLGSISRSSLRSISLWMRQIYTYGDYGYGVKDNPHRERRRRRRRDVPEPGPESRTIHKPVDADSEKLRQRVQTKEAVNQSEESRGPIDLTGTWLPDDQRPTIHDRTASQDHAMREARQTPPIPPSHPGIPPPIVAAAEQALDRATIGVGQDTHGSHKTDGDESGTTMGIPDQYMKYLTLGLSTLGKSNTSKPTSETTRPSSSGSTKRIKKDHGAPASEGNSAGESNDEAPMMTQMDPMPDEEPVAARIAAQRRLENKGHFIIGFKGDIDAPEDDLMEGSDASFGFELGGTRTILRTLQVAMTPVEDSVPLRTSTSAAQGLARNVSDYSTSSTKSRTSPRRVRVVIYARRPFMYCFLFKDRTESLQYARFYRELHWSLTSIHKPLLSSTSVSQVAQRIEDSHEGTFSDAASIHSSSSGRHNNLPSRGSGISSNIFDLIYDPRTLTLHTSIPNIPEPGSLAAEGLLTGRNVTSNSQGWNRLDALNVHSQILNSMASVRGRWGEIERTSKTSRGWWVVWMRIPPSVPAVHVESNNDNNNGNDDTPGPPQTTRVQQTGDAEQDTYRTAFLVRKSSDAGATSKASTGSRMASGMFQSLGFARAEDRTGGAGAGWGPGALAGGIGFDARQYVEGLLSLNR